jgi:hypothetical protein
MRCALFTHEWTSAGNGALAELLGPGWSGPEAWGVWGVGPSHILNLPLFERPKEDVLVEIDTAAALVGTRLTQDVDVFAGGKYLASWHFSVSAIRAQWTVQVPAAAVTAGEWGFPVLVLEFRPRSVVPIVELDPSRNDSRPLGLGLFGIRRGARR